MKRFVLAAMFAIAASSSQAADVGVSVHVNQPGVYGRIDIGRVPQQPPVLMYPQPVIIQQPAVVVQQPPMYLHVPPGHSKNWRKHCHRYQACGQPVYFVRDDWYQRHYAPQQRVQQPQRDRDDRHDHHDHDDHPGKGHGHGKGKHKD